MPFLVFVVICLLNQFIGWIWFFSACQGPDSVPNHSGKNHFSSPWDRIPDAYLPLAEKVGWGPKSLAFLTPSGLTREAFDRPFQASLFCLHGSAQLCYKGFEVAEGSVEVSYPHQKHSCASTPVEKLCSFHRKPLSFPCPLPAPDRHPRLVGHISLWLWLSA